MFAFLLTLVGFKFVDEIGWAAIVIGCAFALATVSIMLFNDLIDREHDVKKGKLLAAQSPFHLFNLWWNITRFGLRLLLTILLFVSAETSVFVGVVWILGLWYSLNRQLVFPWNNLLVARCSIAPLFAGCVYAGTVSALSAIIGWIIFWIIFSNEIAKDAQDATIDQGYKVTLATKNKPRFAFFIAALMQYPALAALAVAHAIGIVPLGSLVLLGLCSAAFTFYAGVFSARAFDGRNISRTVEICTGVFLAFFLTILLI